MELYPVCEWYLGDLQDVSEWANDLARLPKSKKLHMAISMLRQYSIRMQALIELPPDDDEAFDNAPASPSIPPPPPSASASLPVSPPHPRPTTRSGGSRQTGPGASDYTSSSIDPSVIHVQRRAPPVVPSVLVISPVSFLKS